MTHPDELARRYAAAEASLEPQKALSIARGPIGLLAVLLFLLLAVGVVAAIDLNRLQTPGGTALAWTGAAVFGECTAYERLSVAEQPEDRSDDAVCRDLRQGTEQARATSGSIGIDVLSVERQGREATVEVEVRRPEGTRRVALPLRRQGDGWVVVRTEQVCEAVGCA